MAADGKLCNTKSCTLGDMQYGMRNMKSYSRHKIVSLIGHTIHYTLVKSIKIQGNGGGTGDSFRIMQGPGICGATGKAGHWNFRTVARVNWCYERHSINNCGNMRIFDATPFARGLCI